MATSEYEIFRSVVYDYFDGSKSKARFELGKVFKKLIGNPEDILQEALSLSGLNGTNGLNASSTNVENIKRGNGRTDYFIVIYYWIHKNLSHTNYSSEVDKIVFGVENHHVLDFNKKWQLGTENEIKGPNADFYDLACRKIEGNSGVDSPAGISFSPYMEVKEVNGFYFGFTEIQISTSLMSTDTDVTVFFDELYDKEQQINNAIVVKSGAPYRGKWNVRSADGNILSGVINFEGEVVAIHCLKETYDFKVELRANNFHSVVRHSDGSEINEKNKKTILKMLISDELLGAKSNSKSLKSVTDVKLIEQRCRLSKVPIYET